jgi:hypothetical protein
MSKDQNQPDELSSLKARAELMGIPFHPSIGLEKLREKVNGAVTGDGAAAPDEAPAQPAVETAGQRRKRLKLEASKLVRIRVTCMNPAKKEWEGEIFTAGNSAVGTFKKFVPYNNDASEGWHVPNIILQLLKEKKCQVFVNGKTAGGVTKREGKLIKEFGIEILDQLSPAELDELARRQAVGQTVD